MKSTSKFKKIILSSVFSIFVSSLTAMDLTPRTSYTYWPETLLTTPKKPENITWTPDGRYYLLSSGEKVYIGLASKPEYPNSITSGSGKIIWLGTAQELQDGNDPKEFILSVSDKNYVAKSLLPRLVTEVEHSLKKNIKITTSDFAPNANFVAIAQSNGEITLLRHLTNVRKFIEDGKLKGHVRSVTGLAFSPNSEFLASASADGALFVWKVNDNNILTYQLTGSKTKLPVRWLPDSKKLLVAESSKKLVIRNLQDKVLQIINLNAPIKDFYLTPDGKQIITLGTDNVIYLYNLLSGEYTGFIPAFNKTEITSFALNPEETKIMVGHKDGSVFLMNLADIYMAPGTTMTAGQDTKSGIDSKSGKDRKNQKEDEEAAKTQAGPANANATGFGKFRDPHSIEIRTDFKLFQSPYSMGGGIEIGYTNAKLLKPFYFGGLVKLDLGFPQSNFPYQYRDANGNVIPAPDLAGASFVIPVGYSFFPMSNDFEIFSEIQGGVVVHTLYLPGVGASQLAVGGTVGLATGVAWKQITLYIGGNFDFVAGFLFTGGLAYRIEF